MNPSKIVCVGWNYRPHITETDAELPVEPIIFTKPVSCLIGSGDDIVIPEGVTNVQHEVELALIIGKRCRNVPESEARACISHVAVFNDVTARDMQTEARNTGNPWALAKGMDTFGPMSECVPADGMDLSDLHLELSVNGEVRQRGWTGDMIFTPQFVVSYISRFMTLEPGDIIATGTPEGITELHPGDTVKASIGGVGELINRVV